MGSMKSASPTDWLNDSRWPKLPEQGGELRGVPQVEAGDDWPDEGGVHGHAEPDAKAQELHECRRLFCFVLFFSDNAKYR